MTIIMNSKLGKIQKQVITAYFKVLSRHVLGRTETNHENLN